MWHSKGNFLHACLDTDLFDECISLNTLQDANDSCVLCGRLSDLLQPPSASSWMTWALKSGQLAVFGVKYKGSNYPVGTTNEMFPDIANTCNTHFLRNNILPAYLKTSWFPLSGWCCVRKKHYSAVSRVLSQLLSLFPTAVSLKQLTWMPSHSSSILSECTLNMVIKPSLKPVLILLLC